MWLAAKSRTPTETTNVQIVCPDLLSFPHARSKMHLFLLVAREWGAGVHVVQTQSCSWQPLAGLLMSLGGSSDRTGSSFIAEQEGHAAILRAPNPLFCTAIKAHTHKPREHTAHPQIRCMIGLSCAVSADESSFSFCCLSVFHAYTHTHSWHYLNNKSSCTCSLLSNTN